MHRNCVEGEKIKFLILLFAPLLFAIIAAENVTDESELGFWSFLTVALTIACWGYLIVLILRGSWRLISGSNEEQAKEATITPAESQDVEKFAEEAQLEARVRFEDANKEIGRRDLCLDVLGNEGSYFELDDLIELIALKADPVVRFVFAYILMEQLDTNASETKRELSLGKFCYYFFKQELSDEELEINEIDRSVEGIVSDEDWKNQLIDDDESIDSFKGPFLNAHWFYGIDLKCCDAFEKFEKQEERSSVCTSLCLELLAEVEEGQKFRFTSLARKILKEDDMYSPSIESALISIEF